MRCGLPGFEEYLVAGTSKLIIGLGNPGPQYAATRHNVGFMVVDVLAREAGIESWSSGCRSLVSRAVIGGREALLAKPLTYMNLSGQALSLLLSQHGLLLQDTLVIADDFNLPFGKIRLRKSGSAGGHHGLESILRAVESEDLLRVRLGIGEEEAPADKAQFVLSDFPPKREAELSDMIRRAANAVAMILNDGVGRAMSVFNA
jgi:PTH1 family peptidyl-tRNA hydrolase